MDAAFTLDMGLAAAPETRLMMLCLSVSSRSVSFSTAAACMGGSRAFLFSELYVEWWLALVIAAKPLPQI